MEKAEAIAVFSLTLLIVGPILHEVMHGLAAILVGCRSFSISLGLSGIYLSSKISILCDLSWMESLFIVSAGVLLSSALALAMFLLFWRNEKIVVFSSAVLMGNALSMAAPNNDMVVLGGMLGTSGLPTLSGLVLSAISVYLIYLRFIKWEHIQGMRGQHRRRAGNR